jgi:uncharacterized membrane protein YoaT (DUF817 family)
VKLPRKMTHINWHRCHLVREASHLVRVQSGQVYSALGKNFSQAMQRFSVPMTNTSYNWSCGAILKIFIYTGWVSVESHYTFKTLGINTEN